MGKWLKQGKLQENSDQEFEIIKQHQVEPCYKNHHSTNSAYNPYWPLSARRGARVPCTSLHTTGVWVGVCNHWTNFTGFQGGHNGPMGTFWGGTERLCCGTFVTFMIVWPGRGKHAGNMTD